MKMIRKLFPQNKKTMLGKTCKSCNQNFENSTSDYCSVECAAKQFEDSRN